MLSVQSVVPSIFGRTPASHMRTSRGSTWLSMNADAFRSFAAAYTFTGSAFAASASSFVARP
jgi:hypothetical protein